MNGKKHFKGTLSFALAHTQANYKDSEPSTMFSQGVLYRLQWPKNINK